jgi:hypothetical protein
VLAITRSGAIAAIDQKTVLIDDNWVNETVRLDVRSEVGQFLIGHHREQIGDWVDRPRHRRLPRFGDDRPFAIIQRSFFRQCGRPPLPLDFVSLNITAILPVVATVVAFSRDMQQSTAVRPYLGPSLGASRHAAFPGCQRSGFRGCSSA